MKTNANFEVRKTLKTLKDLQLEMEKILKEDFYNKKRDNLTNLNEKCIKYCDLIRKISFDKRFRSELGIVALNDLTKENLKVLSKFGSFVVMNKNETTTPNQVENDKYRVVVEVVKDSNESIHS